MHNSKTNITKEHFNQSKCEQILSSLKLDYLETERRSNLTIIQTSHPGQHHTIVCLCDISFKKFPVLFYIYIYIYIYMCVCVYIYIYIYIYIYMRIIK